MQKKNDIHLNVNGTTIADQQQVDEELVEYFATVADGIGGQAADLRSIDDFTNHSQLFKGYNKNTGVPKEH